jgi:hypothetical protein
MANFCIPKQYAEKILTYVRSGEVNIEKLYKMTSDERREMFSKFSDSIEVGKFLNTKFEEAMVSNSKDSMLKWAKNVFGVKDKEGDIYKSLITKIENLGENGAFDIANNDVILKDLVMHKLGVYIRPEEIKAIVEKSRKLEEMSKKFEDVGDLGKEKEITEYLLAKKEMDDYLNSINPQSRLKIFSSTIGRGSMLLSVKSPIINIESNTVQAIMEAVGRRVSSGRLKGTNGDLVKDYVKYVNRIYQKTGYDVSRILNDEIITGGGKTLGEEMIHSQGPGKLRKYGRFHEDFTFKQLMGAPDVAFSSFHFADSVNLESMNMAEALGAKGYDVKKVAKEMMVDAMRIRPLTKEGEVLREKAIMDATYATYTNDSITSKFALGARKLLNDATGDFRLGDQLNPFVKTPSNVIESNLDYAGLGAFKSIYQMQRIIRTEGKGKLKDPKVIRELSRGMVRSGLGIGGAAIISTFIPEVNFMGAYDPARKDIEELRNSNWNAIKIGDKWISMDYFGPLAAPLTGIMYAKKYGKGAYGTTKAFTQGVGTQFYRIPGADTIVDLFTEERGKKGGEIGADTKSAFNISVDYLRSRIVPGGISDTAKVFDSSQRDTEGSAVGRVQASIPGLRNMLPEKKNMLGETMKDEGVLTNIFIGSRMKTENNSPAAQEVVRLADAGEKPEIVNWKKTQRKDVEALEATESKEVVEQVKTKYQERLRASIERIQKTQSYKVKSDQEKKAIIGAESEAAMKSVMAPFYGKINKYKREQKALEK